MPYKNLPIREVEKFAEEDPSQVRRVLCYLAHRKFRVWSDFVANR